MPINNTTVTKIAEELGFDLVGFARADKLEVETKNLQEWLNRGYQAGMGYMERNIDRREDVREILPGAKSVISLAMNYYTDEQHSGEENKGKVSGYAWGKDYHYIIWEKLDILEGELKEIDESFEAKTYVDTGPVMDKAWAVKAGIGWLGKHTNVINREYGSWLFLAEVITNWEFEYNEPIEDFCGSCVACIDACPTDAIVEPYVLDSSKCISYLTIENKGEIPDKFKDQFDDWIFGCDICQDVCPWNKKFSKLTNKPDFYPKGNKELDLDEVEQMSNSQFKRWFRESPIKRAKPKGLRKNADFIRR